MTRLRFPALACSAVIALAATSCAAQAESEPPVTVTATATVTQTATVTATPSTAPASTQPAPDEPAFSGAYKFGQTHSYPDRLRISIGAPKRFTPNSYASVDGGVSKNKTYVRVKVTITNATQQTWHPSYDDFVAVSGGVQSNWFIDDGLSNPQDVGAVRAGKSASYELGFEAADPRDMQVEAHLYGGAEGSTDEREAVIFANN